MASLNMPHPEPARRAESKDAGDLLGSYRPIFAFSSSIENGGDFR